MLVLINGLSHFGAKLKDDLREADPSRKYVFLRTYDSKWAQLLFILLLPFAKVVISFNGVSTKSGSLTKVVNRKKKLIMFWHGTDALLAKERFDNKTIYRDYIDHAVHFSDAPWLLEELMDVLPNSEVLDFKTIEIDPLANNFKSLQVLTYVPDNKEEFYGLEWILEAAKNYPEVLFNVMGNSGGDKRLIENVNYLGWIDQQKSLEFYKNSPLFLRLTKHDGNALSVAQALSTGAEVIWTCAHPNCHLVNDKEQFILKFNALIQKKKTDLKRNQSNIEFVATHFNKKNVMANFIKKIDDVAQS
jgi:glycosyltransferase involved in cell wall biosynthesis